MPAISARDAIQRLAREVEDMRPSDLREFYFELFPAEERSAMAPKGEGAADRSKILQKFREGLEIEEIVDLWNVAYPADREVHYDDEAGMIRYSDEPKPLAYAD